MEAHARSLRRLRCAARRSAPLRIDAANLPELAPTRDLWAGIAARIETPVVELNNARRCPAVAAARRRCGVGSVSPPPALVAVTATVTHQIDERRVDRRRGADSAVTPVGAAASDAGRATALRWWRCANTARRTGGRTYDNEIAGSAPSSTTAGAARFGDGRRRSSRISRSSTTRSRSARRRSRRIRRAGILIESLNDALDNKVQLLRTAAALPSQIVSDTQ